MLICGRGDICWNIGCAPTFCWNMWGWRKITLKTETESITITDTSSIAIFSPTGHFLSSPNLAADCFSLSITSKISSRRRSLLAVRHPHLRSVSLSFLHSFFLSLFTLPLFWFYDMGFINWDFLNLGFWFCNVIYSSILADWCSQ